MENREQAIKRCKNYEMHTACMGTALSIVMQKIYQASLDSVSIFNDHDDTLSNHVTASPNYSSALTRTLPPKNTTLVECNGRHAARGEFD